MLDSLQLLDPETLNAFIYYLIVVDEIEYKYEFSVLLLGYIMIDDSVD